MARIFCIPCAEGPEAWAHAYHLLKALYAASSPRRHEWCDSPETADIILLCNPLQKSGDVSRTQRLRLKYPNKCFILSEQWTPVPRYAGIYANAPRKALWRGRFRTGSYALHHPDFKNPYVQNFSQNQALPPESRNVLFSFAGRNCHPIRDKLFHLQFRRPDIVLQDTTTQFDAFRHGIDGKDTAQREYFRLCLRSKYILCPRGVGPNSIRLYEALKLGIAPIIVSDDWIPCEGPDWNRFAIFVAEKDIAHVGEIATAHENEFEERGREARRAHDDFFAPQSYFNYLVSAAQSIQRSRLISESMILRLEPGLDFAGRMRAKILRAFDGRRGSTNIPRSQTVRRDTVAAEDSRSGVNR